MEILNYNFESKFDLICKSIHTADLIAIDTELSGLSVGFDDQVNDYDSVEERY